MIDRPVAIGGPPGSGKTTAARRLAERLGLELVSAGAEFRAEAARRGLDLEAFSRYAESHPEVDRELDERMLAAARPGRLLDARLAGALLRRRGRPVLWIAVVASPDVRAERLATRDGVPLEHARRQMAEREASEARRFRALYGFDPDRERPDLIVDSTALGPDEVVAALLERLRAGARGGPEGDHGR